MALMNKSDQAIRDIAMPILLDTIYGANNTDWAQFSRHMPDRDVSDVESRRDVERQWREDVYLTKFTDQPEFLGLIRKSACVVVLWKLRTSINDEEYLERLYLAEEDGKVCQVGIWTD